MKTQKLQFVLISLCDLKKEKKVIIKANRKILI